MPKNLSKLCNVSDDKIMVWRDLIIIFYLVMCGLVLSAIGFALEAGLSRLKLLLEKFKAFASSKYYDVKK